MTSVSLSVGTGRPRQAQDVWTSEPALSARHLFGRRTFLTPQELVFVLYRIFHVRMLQRIVR